MAVDRSAADLVRQLNRVGLRPDERLVEQILSYGAEARPELLTLATNLAQLHDEDVQKALGPLHALRLLGEVPAIEMIAPLLAGLPIEIYGDEDVPARIYSSEVLQIVGRIGAEALPALLAIADDPEQAQTQRMAALQALAYVAAYAGEVRDEIVTRCQAYLESAEEPFIVTAAAIVLAELGDSSSYKTIMAGYRNGRVLQNHAPAASARQYLLSGGRKELSCVAHPLWERYDHHGPTFQTQQQPS